MSTTALHPLAADYLDRLRHAGRGLPRGSRRELLEEVEAHLLETTSSAMSDAEVLTVLDRLGNPEEIVEAQQPSAPPRANGAGAREWSAIVLLLFGGFIFGVGWLVGLVLLWSSRVWTTGDKWIGTLFIPGGYATVLIVNLLAASVTSAGTESPSPDILAIVIAVLLILAPLASAIYLGRRAMSSRPA